MTAKPRIVIDTNVLISRLLLKHSTAAQAVDKAIDHCLILASEATLSELVRVVPRSKFDRYVTRTDRENFISEYLNVVEMLPVSNAIVASRDVQDDIFLNLAVQGLADYLITGDQDLLVLNPFLGVKIITPNVFLTAG